MKTPILLIIFNRPETTQIVFDAIKETKPKYLYVAADGPRVNKNGEFEICMQTRSILSQIDWDCELKTMLQEKNMGCLRAVNQALNWFFENEEMGIIIEDDCVPTLDFFNFMEWGLQTFKNENKVGMISGSNLIAHRYSIDTLNGFSAFINIWGWGSWRRVWQSHDLFNTLRQLKEHKNLINNHQNLNWWQKIFWYQLFKYTIFEGSTWDFQLQYTFFKNKYLSVFPKQNLIHNIGFSDEATHTKFDIPTFVKDNIPDGKADLFNLKIDLSYEISNNRDYLLGKEIWHYNLFSTLKLYIGNILRFMF